METRTRIQETAIRLFNESGTSAVSTNHISAAMGISPGNLYYHFGNKEEIIRAIYEELFATWDRVLTIPEDHVPTLADLQRLVADNFAIMWQYRFVYRETVALQRRDPELRRRSLEVRQRGFAGFRELFAQFVAAGIFNAPADPRAVDNAAELCWLISEFWLPSVELGGQTVSAELMEHGIEIMMQVLQPFIAREPASRASGESHEEP